MLARYYRHEQGLKGKGIYNQVEAHLVKNYSGYNPVFWQDVIVRGVNRSKKYPLIKIDSIPVDERELSFIKKFNNVRLERVAFTMLCYAKYHNIRNHNNNNWVNTSLSEIFNVAGVSVGMMSQCLMLNELWSMGHINYSERVDNLNICVNYINTTYKAKVGMEVTDFRRLGFQYMNYSEGGYDNCKRCGVLFKQNKKNNALYCKDCRGYVIKDVKKVVCCDCGEDFTVKSYNTRSKRCPSCYVAYRREYDRKRKSNQK